MPTSAAISAFSFSFLRSSSPKWQPIMSKGCNSLLERNVGASTHIELVGTTGFEPVTTTPPVWCATRLRYAPIYAALY